MTDRADRGGARRAPQLVTSLRPGLPRLTGAADAPVSTQAVLSTIGVLVQGLVRFVFSVAVGNTLGRVALGSASSSIALALFVSLLFPTAAAQTTTKFVARSRGEGEFDEALVVTTHLARWAAIASLLLAVGAAVLAPAVLDIGVPEAVMTGALVLAYSGYMVVRGILFGAGFVRRATVWDVLSSVAALAAIAAVLLLGWEQLILLPLVLGYAVYVLANLPPRVRRRPSPARRRELRGFLVLSLVNSLAVGGLLQLSMVAARFYDQAGAGLFAAALTLATPASLVSRSISLVLLPNLASAYGSGDRGLMRRQTDLSTRALSLLSLLTFGPLMLLSPLLTSLFFPTGFQGAEALLPVLLAAVMVSNVVIGATNTLLIREQAHARVVVAASTAGAVIAVLGWLVFGPSGGVEAISWGYLVGTVVVAVVPFAVAWRLDRQQWTGVASRFVLGSLAAALLVAWQQDHGPSAWQQVLTATAFALGWLLVSGRDVKATLSAFRAARR